MFNWLLIFVPVTVAIEHFYPQRYLLVFLTAAVAILPLAGWMSRATEHLAQQTGEGIGGLLNATFGNAAELIIAFAALRAGLHDVVKASIAGSIIGNILLVLGASMLAGGLRHSQQAYNAAGTRSQATLLTIELDIAHDEVSLSITDDGRGIREKAAPGHFGLTGMRERTARIGGTLEVLNPEGGGTVVRVVVPLRSRTPFPTDDSLRTPTHQGPGR